MIRQRPPSTAADLEARTRAIAKLAYLDAPHVLADARHCLGELEDFQVALVQHRCPPFRMLGHALQAAAAENA